MPTLADFKSGDRVALHPATDLWMRGARYGTVDRVGGRWVYVRLDVTDRIVRLAPWALSPAASWRSICAPSEERGGETE